MLHLTEEIVARDHLTTLMVTHNMRNAIQYGNRLIMMDAGRIVVDVRGEEKKEPLRAGSAGKVQRGKRPDAALRIRVATGTPQRILRRAVFLL